MFVFPYWPALSSAGVPPSRPYPVFTPRSSIGRSCASRSPPLSTIRPTPTSRTRSGPCSPRSGDDPARRLPACKVRAPIPYKTRAPHVGIAHGVPCRYAGLRPPRPPLRKGGLPRSALGKRKHVPPHKRGVGGAEPVAPKQSQREALSMGSRGISCKVSARPARLACRDQRRSCPGYEPEAV